MLFNSFPFAVFFAVTLGLLALAPRFRIPVLLAASLAFYALWLPSYLLLLLGTLGVNHALLIAIERRAPRKLPLVLSIVFTLGILAVFKYAAFGVELALPFLRRLTAHPIRAPHFALPLGISFYSFEIISIAVDVYKGRIARPRFGRYVLFVTFFPHLIAGPIMRGGELLPQLDLPLTPSPERTRRGVWLFARGLAKKTIFADFLLQPYVSEIFETPGGPSGPSHLVAIYSFAFQIYFDFSGYTDMARGLACLLGLELPENFREPYLSRDPAEFWRRWHMTLSRWLRDYLYIPLGGNRRGKNRTLVNLMLTMVLGGLWHGAGLNFVLWGALHGAFLVVHRLLGVKTRDEQHPLSLRDVPAMVVTFHAVCLAWIPFRAPAWSDTRAFLRGLSSGGYLTDWPLVPVAIVVLCALFHVAERTASARLPALGQRLASSRLWPVAEGALLGILFTCAVLASGAGSEFIYFQF